MAYRILILGDHQNHVGALKEEAEKAGLEVMVVGSIAQGIKYMETVDHIDVIVCHAYLERGDVFEFVKAVKRNPAYAKTHFMLVSCQFSELTSFFDQTLPQTAEMLGADKYVMMREFDVRRLLREVKAALPEEKAS